MARDDRQLPVVVADRYGFADIDADHQPAGFVRPVAFGIPVHGRAVFQAAGFESELQIKDALPIL